MKRVLAVILTLIMLVSVTGCASIFPDVLLKIKPDKVDNMKIERLSDGLTAEYAAEDKTIAKFISAVNNVLFYDSGKCDNTSEHIFHITIDSENDEFDIFLNEDGSLCLNGEHYIVDFSSKATLNLSKVNRWVDDANRPENEEENPEESQSGNETPDNESDPQQISDSIVNIKVREDIATANGTDYFIAEAEILKENAVIFASTANSGTIDIYCKTPIGSSILYVDGSMEQSGGKMIYVSTDITGIGTTVYAVNINTNKIITITDLPSSDIIVFETPELSLLGLGWMVIGDEIVPINLASASPDKEKAYSITDDAIAKAINNSFFDNFHEGYDNKSVELSAENDNRLIITVTESSSEGNPDLVYTFKYDCVNKTMEQI